MTGPADPNDRFGAQDALRAVKESHGVNNPFDRMGMYVPTRAEVGSTDPLELYEVLEVWTTESPTELIPTRTQIEQVRALLVERPDADTQAVRRLVELCDDYLDVGGSESPLDRDPDVHSGDLVFRGTRVPVSVLTTILRAGGTVDDFVVGYPGVRRRHVNAVFDLILEALERLYDDDLNSGE